MPDKGRGFDAGDIVVHMPLDEEDLDPFEADQVGMVQISVAPDKPDVDVGDFVKVFPPTRADAALVLARYLGAAGCRVKFEVFTTEITAKK